MAYLFGPEFGAGHFALIVAIVYGAACTGYGWASRDLLKRERDWTAILMRLLNGQYDQLQERRERFVVDTSLPLRDATPCGEFPGQFAGRVHEMLSPEAAPPQPASTPEPPRGDGDTQPSIEIDLDERMRQVANQIRADQARRGRDLGEGPGLPPPLPTIALTRPIPLVTPVDWLVRRLTGSQLPR